MSGMVLVLVLVVALQVVVFQFLSPRLFRALPDLLVGPVGLPADVAAEVATYRGRVGRGDRVAGVVFLLILAVAVLAGAAAGVGAGAVKLAAAGVSLASSGALAAGYLRGRKLSRRLASRVPAPAVRTAPVARRGLSQHYPPLWEVVVLVVWWAAAVPAVIGLMAGESRTALVIVLVFQAAVALGGLALALRHAVGARLPQRARFGLADSLGEAVDRALRRVEMRVLLALRIGLLALLGLQAAEYAAASPTAPPGAQWAVVAALLMVFGVYLVAPARAAGFPRAGGAGR
jgi:hypothetical protein